jgi:hypothetical protein
VEGRPPSWSPCVGVWLLELNSELLLVFRRPKEKAKEKRRRKGGNGEVER